MSSHIVVLYQHYRPPDCPANARSRSLLKTLRDHARVTLITTDAWRSTRATHDFTWFPEDIDTVEFHVPYANRMSTVERFQSYASYAAKALWHTAYHLSPDLVYGVSTPLSTAMSAALAAKWHGVPWIFELHDLWPAFPIQMGAIPFQWMERALCMTERALYNSAAEIVTMSPDMTAHVEDAGQASSRVTTVLPGSDRAYLQSDSAPSPSQLIDRHGLPESPRVLYAGTFGRANDIPCLMETARRCADHDLSFLFVGRGYYEPDLQRLAQRLSSVHLIPPQPQHYMGNWYGLADLSLVPFLDRPVLATNSPAKFFDSLTMGTPVIVTNPGWTKTFVERHDCGWYVPASRPELLADRIRSLLRSPAKLERAGRNASRTAERFFIRSEQYDRISSIVQRSLS